MAEDTDTEERAGVSGSSEAPGKSRGLTIAKLIGVVLIVALFSCFYCWSFWNPSGWLSNVKVGIINDDQSAEVNGETVNVGQSIIDALADNDQVAWTVLADDDISDVPTDADGNDGGSSESDLMENASFPSGIHLVFRIPADFSEKIASGESGLPEVSDLIVYEDTRYNFLFSQFTSRITTALQNVIDRQIAASYVEGAYDGLYAARDGLQGAADGSGELADGAQTLSDGLTTAQEGSETAVSAADQIASGADSLADATTQVADGATTVDAGASSLASGNAQLASGAAQVSSGAQSLADATGTLADGAQTLSAGVDTALSSLPEAAVGVQSLADASSRVTSGLDLLSGKLGDGATGLSQIAAGLDAAQSQTQQLAAGQQQVAQAYEAAVAAAQAGGSYGGRTTAEWLAVAQAASSQVQSGLSQLADGIGSASTATSSAADQLTTAASTVGTSGAGSTETLAGASSAIASGATTLAESLEGARSGADQLASGASTLATGADTLADKTSELASGAASVASGADTAASGATTLAAVTSTLASGANQTATGADTLASGAETLSFSLPTLAEGLASAQSGADQLASGATTLQTSLSDGADQIADSLGASSDEMGDYVSDPVDTTKYDRGGLDYYGQGFSPFFMTTALWLGALLLFFVVEPFYPVREHAGRMRTIFGRLPRYVAVCALESAAVVAMAQVIGVTSSYDVNMALMWLFAFGVSLCFMLIMQFLNLTFDLVGKAIAILILIVQLAGAGGTLPTDLGRGLVSVLQPWLPFTYSVDIFREAITYGSLGVMGQDLLVLVGMGLGCLALSVACWPIACKVKNRNDAQKLAALADQDAPSDSRRNATGKRKGVVTNVLKAKALRG